MVCSRATDSCTFGMERSERDDRDAAGWSLVNSEVSDDEHWMVINGRRWRRTDPELPENLVVRLTSHLGRARSAVGVSRRSGDAEVTAAARVRVGLAKRGLGERGPRWWECAIDDRIERAREALEELDRLAP